MGDGLKDRASVEMNAFEALMQIYVDRHRSVFRLREWKEAQGQLAERYTRERAAESSENCAQRIRYLSVPEPEPVIEDFFPGDTVPMPTGKCRLVLELMQRQLRLSRDDHPARERARQRDLQWAHKLLKDQRAAEVGLKIYSPKFALVSEVDDSGTVETSAMGPVAALASTPSELRALIKGRQAYWEFVAFVSLLAIKREQVLDRRDEYRLAHESAAVEDIVTFEQFKRRIGELDDERIRLQRELACYMTSAPVQRLFGDREKYVDPTLQDIDIAVRAVIEFYDCSVRLGEEVRSVTGREDWYEITEGEALLIEQCVEVIDCWITQLLGFVDLLPTYGNTQGTEDVNVSAPALHIDSGDDDLYEQVIASLDALNDSSSNEEFLRRWNQDFNRPSVNVGRTLVELCKSKPRQLIGLLFGCLLSITAWANEGLSQAVLTASGLGAIWLFFSFIVWLAR